jgi:predicted DNA binding protein
VHPPESFATGTLDTLPMQIAVLDDAGEIVFTNRAWDESATGDEAADRDWRGVDYQSAIDLEGDGPGRRAHEGIGAVLSGERESFALEYPCHGPDEEQWFLMRATPFELEGRRGVAVVHVDITDRKRAEMEVEETATELRAERAHLEHLLDRINGLVEDVTRAVVGGETRSAMERAVCETFADADPYVGAWIGHLDLARERVRPAAAAGIADSVGMGTVGEDRAESGGGATAVTDGEGGSPDGATGAADGSLALEEDHPTARAVDESEPQVVVDPEILATDPVVDRLDDPDRVEAMAVLPLSYRGNRYGALTLYVADADVVDDRECVVLAALGRILTHGINARETKRSLAGAPGVELTVEVDDPALLPNALSAATPGHLEYRGAIHRDDEVLAFFTLEDGDPERVDAGDFPSSLRAVRTLTVDEDIALLEVSASSFLGVELADHGGSLREVESEDGRSRVTVDLPGESTARSVYDLLTGHYDRVELVGYRERDRPGETPPEFRARVTDRLTDRQATVLRKAYLGGYYESSRAVTGEQLADSMDITRATFHQHLRAAERKVFEELFDASTAHPGSRRM